MKKRRPKENRVRRVVTIESKTDAALLRDRKRLKTFGRVVDSWAKREETNL